MLSHTKSWILNPINSSIDLLFILLMIYIPTSVCFLIQGVSGIQQTQTTTFVKFHQDLDKSVSKPMAEYNTDDLIGRTLLLPPNLKGERHRASIKQKVSGISDRLDEDQNAIVDNINFLLDVEEITSHHFL